jgi:hypothetical protein
MLADAIDRYLGDAKSHPFLEFVSMSRMFLGTMLSAALLCGFASAADTATECLKEGDSLGAFYVTKIAGAENDGVEAGDELCYRCKYGQSPMVMVFTRKGGSNVNEFVGQLDKAVAANKESKLKGLITILGDDQSTLKSQATAIATESGAKNIPVVVAADSETGPLSYRIDPASDMTVVVAKGGKVVNTHSFSADSVDVAAVMKEVEQMLN